MDLIQSRNLFAYGLSDFDHIRNNECPNDSRRIMPLVPSVPFLFLTGKYALENSSIFVVCSFRCFLVSIIFEQDIDN